MKKYLTLHEELTRVKKIMGITESILSNIKDKILYNIEGEIEEIERTVMELNQTEGLGISVKDVVESFMESEETTLTREVWNKLENTESNEIKKGDFDSGYIYLTYNNQGHLTNIYNNQVVITKLFITCFNL